MAVITKKKYPLLYAIYDKKPFYPGVRNSVVDKFNKAVNYKGISDCDVRFICSTFLNDAVDNFHKIIDAVEFEVGLFLYVSSGGSVFKLEITHSGTIDRCGYKMYFVTNDGVFVLEKKPNADMFFIDNYGGKSNMSDIEINLIRESVLAVHSFIKYAEEESVVLPPKKKVKKFHCRYKSDLPFAVFVYDINWYTESVQKHPFSVRGHWRRAKVGKGRKEIKMTKVKPHVKSGYTKGAYMND